MRRCLHYMSTKITGFHDLTFEYYSFCKNRIFAPKRRILHSKNIPRLWLPMFRPRWLSKQCLFYSTKKNVFYCFRSEVHLRPILGRFGHFPEWLSFLRNFDWFCIVKIRCPNFENGAGYTPKHNSRWKTSETALKGPTSKTGKNIFSRWVKLTLLW